MPTKADIVAGLSVAQLKSLLRAHGISVLKNDTRTTLSKRALRSLKKNQLQGHASKTSKTSDKSDVKAAATKKRKTPEQRATATSVAKKRKTILPPPPTFNNPCLSSRSAAEKCFNNILQQYPVLVQKCPCPTADIKKVQKATGAQTLLESGGQAVGLVTSQGKVEKFSNPVPIPSAPPLPTAKVQGPLKRALESAPSASSQRRANVSKAVDTGDLLAAIRKGKQLKKVTAAEKKKASDVGLESVLLRAMAGRRGAISGEATDTEDDDDW